jgi:hypothetical protein
MKSTFISTVFVLTALTLSSQANKPVAGDFGIRTGFYFQNAPGGSIMIGKRLPKNLESGIGIVFAFNNSSRTITDTIQAASTTGFISAKSENVSKTFNYRVHLSPYLVYHFPIKNNVDVFAGGYLAFFAGNTPRNENIVRVYADNYERKSITTNKFPLTFGIGAGFLVGAEYYVHKNIAVGLAGNLGFSSTMQFGKQLRKTELINSGSLNPSQNSSITETASTIKNIDNNVSLSGGVGFNLTFFFTVKEKRKKMQQQGRSKI